MLTKAQIEHAVGRGVISADQAEALIGLTTDGARAQPTTGAVPQDRFAGGAEERFRIANGFNEVFIALGCLFLAVGMMMSFAWSGGAGSSLPLLREMVLWSAVYLAALWALSEYLTGRRRMLAPSIVLVIAMCLLAMMIVMPMAFVEWPTSNLLRTWTLKFLLLPGAVLAVAGAHYIRFRFPFSLFPLAFSLNVMLAVLLSLAVPDVVTQYWRVIMLVFGTATFLAALGFDLSDPQRQTNRSDGGFWLHLIAAPLIVHPLMPGTIQNAGGVFAAFGALLLIAIVIDRRAILMASLTYVMAAVGYLVSQRGVGAAQAAFLIPVIIGIGIIALGSGWQALRRLVWHAIPTLDRLEALRPPALRP
jgi:hypothetical protein